MFENLRRWLGLLTPEELRQAGRDWAKAELRAGRHTMQMILDRCEAPFDGPHPFDEGACAFVYELQEKQNG